MVRDFVKDRLYASHEGYFHREETQVGMLKEPIEFSKLLGYYAYRKELESKYPKNAWITPSEVFYPYYGYMIANYIAEVCNESSGRFSKSENNYSKFQIVEIGPGTGALAQSVIEYLSFNMFKNKMNFEYH
jgi:SAM-dependent MidA family methyltransferase